jgi:hypothetical protein
VRVHEPSRPASHVRRHAAAGAAAGRAGLSTRLTVWPPLPPGLYLRRPQPLPFPLDDPRCRLFELARHALWHGVRALGLRPGDEVLVPHYHHGSEIEVLAQLGLECRFYEGDRGLEPVEAELEALATSRTRALLLIHYAGFPQASGRWRRWCDDRGLLLLEDAAQAWLAGEEGRPVGSLADVAVFCLYKTFGVPDGAALVTKGTVTASVRRPRLDPLRLARRHAAWVRGRLAVPSSQPEPTAAVVTPDDDFALGAPLFGPHPAAAFLLRRMGHDVAETRRANYRGLLERLPAGSTAPPFDEVPAGASPFVFPLSTSRKDDALRRLRRAGIHAFDFWSFGHPLAQASQPESVRERRGRTIGLPVHQELRSADLDHMALCVADLVATERA